MSYGSQGLKIALVSSYLRVLQAAGQVEILIFLVKIFFPHNVNYSLVMQGKCLFSDISRPGSQDKNVIITLCITSLDKQKFSA